MKLSLHEGMALWPFEFFDLLRAWQNMQQRAQGDKLSDDDADTLLAFLEEDKA